SGRAGFQPIWAEDVAECVMAALPGGSMGDESAGARYELAGPETLTYAEIVGCVLRSLRRRRPVVRLPLPLARRTLKLVELLMARRGSADAERLGVLPKPMRAVLGVG